MTYMPCSGLVSLQTLTADGNSVEIAMVGRDGVIGFVPGVPLQRATSRAVVSVSGYTLRVQTRALMAEFDCSASTRQVLLTCWSTFLAEIAQNSACHRFHPARRRLAGWLLSAFDRTGVPRIHLTQEDLAHRLGLQRTGVTAANLALQDLGAIRSRHGHIALLDRGRLEQAACECYRLTSTPASPPPTSPERSLLRDEAHVNVKEPAAAIQVDRYLADRERRTVGNSSPATGGFPAPARFKIRSAFATFPLAARSAKYASVRKADNFSATATLINWFMATPSVLATLEPPPLTTAAVLTRSCFASWTFPQPFECACRGQNLDVEHALRRPKIAQIQGDQHLRAAIDRGLEHHVIVRVCQQRTP